MFVRLDGRGPAYEQVVRAIRSQIEAGVFEHGMRLVPSRELAVQLGLSRNTITAAYERLLADGVLTARVGKGTFVARRQASRAARRSRSRASPTVALSGFATRLLQEVGAQDLPGKPMPGVRHMFQYKGPYTDHSLLREWAKALARSAAYTSPRYSPSQGMESLRIEIAAFLRRRRGLSVDADDIVVVNGAQQAFSLCARVLVDPGDPVLIEEPGYYPMRACLRAYGADLIPGAIDALGLTLEGLALQPRLIVVTPARQFPLGHRLCDERRAALLDYASESGAWLIEDDYDGEFIYEGPLPPTLRSLDSEGRVIYVGSFSKTLFPGVRLGYLVLPSALREAFVAAKFIEDMAAPVVTQAAMALLLKEGTFDRHLLKSVRELRKRRAALIDGLCTLIPGASISSSRAGMNLLVTHDSWTPEYVESLKALALTKGLAIFTTVPYYIQTATEPGLLVGYASMSAAEMQSALKILEECMRCLGRGRIAKKR